MKLFSIGERVKIKDGGSAIVGTGKITGIMGPGDMNKIQPADPSMYHYWFEDEETGFLIGAPEKNLEHAREA